MNETGFINSVVRVAMHLWVNSRNVYANPKHLLDQSKACAWSICEPTKHPCSHFMPPHLLVYNNTEWR